MYINRQQYKTMASNHNKEKDSFAIAIIHSIMLTDC